MVSANTDPAAPAMIFLLMFCAFVLLVLCDPSLEGSDLG